MNMGDAVPQPPWDLPRSCHPMYVLFRSETGDESSSPGMVWPRKSALRSHPCVALSSAPVPISVNQIRPNSTGQVTNHGKKDCRNTGCQGITILSWNDGFNWPVLK
jgi:hypothetical protein